MAPMRPAQLPRSPLLLHLALCGVSLVLPAGRGPPAHSAQALHVAPQPPSWALHLPRRLPRRQGRMTAVVCRAQMGPEDAEVGAPPAPCGRTAVPAAADSRLAVCADPCMHAGPLAMHPSGCPPASDLGVSALALPNYTALLPCNCSSALLPPALLPSYPPLPVPPCP